MASYKQNTKLMAKNSAFMYIQMAVKMLIGLYTVRVVLHALGAEDYGIYNVVGGFVTMFSFITNTLVSASMRFFAYALGKGEDKLLNRYFNSTILSFLILSAVLVVVIEPVGYWFVNHKMVVPAERLQAANWVFQLAVFSFVVRIMAVPFKSLLVAYEKMIVFAIISVLDSFLLLGIAFVIQGVSLDRLKFYSVCIFGVALVSTALYAGWCHSCFRESSRIRLSWEGPLLKELIGYSGWYMFGTMATVVRSQGINILLNVFFSPIVNAARAIAFQINNALNQFVNSFYNAVRPQITKLTAAGERERMLSLVFTSSVISSLLMNLIAVPLLVEMPFVLSLWLGDVPQHTTIFSRLVIITAMVDTLGHPLTTAVCATGVIRNFQVLTGSILMLNLPVSYFLLGIWQDPSLVFVVSILFAAIAQIARIGIMKDMFGMSVKAYAEKVLWRVGLVTFLSLFLSWGFLKMQNPSGFEHLLSIAVSIGMVIALSWFLGLSKSHRQAFLKIVRKVYGKSNSNLK